MGGVEMAGAVSNELGCSGFNLDASLNRHELPFFFDGIGEAGRRLPQLTEAVIDSFGKVLDIFEEPFKLRDPEFYHRNLASYEEAPAVWPAEGAASPLADEQKPAPLDLGYLGRRTRAHYDKVESRREEPELEHKEVLKASASPCPENIHLCGRCFVSLASVRCEACMVYFCGVCANAVHADVLKKSHVLFAANSDLPARFYDEGDENVDLSISLDRHGCLPSYELCDKHPRQEVKYACVSCNFLPLCGICASETHRAPGTNHKVVELEQAVTEVKEFLNDCLSALVDRHNGLSPIIPELDQLSHASEVAVRTSNRSVNCAVQGVFDALKAKQMVIDGEIKNLQQVGSSNLNRLGNLSNAYNKYLIGKIKQLNSLSTLKDPGLALNAFVELRPSFEQLLYHCDDLPDLPLEVPHWQLNTGNLPNLLSDIEYRINSRCEELSGLCNLMAEESANTLSSVEYLLSSGITCPSEPERSPVNLAPDLEFKSISELRGVFTRKDYVHRIPCRRAVTLRGNFLYVYNSDSHFEGSSVESKIDLTAVTVKSFDEDDVTEVSKLVRVGSPNGFEVVERRRSQMRFWIFTSEARNLVLLWFAKLKKIASENYRVNLESFPINRNFVLPKPPRMAHEFKTNRMHGYAAARAGSEKLGSPAHGELGHPGAAPDFKHVAQALRKIKQDSTLLYDKCFAKKNDLSPKSAEQAKPKLELVQNVEHRAELPDTSSEASSHISAGRYELPSPKVAERTLPARRDPVPFKCVDLPKFEYSPQVMSPKSIHRYFEECTLT